MCFIWKFSLKIIKMITPKIGFIVFGVHKDGLIDPMGMPFIDEEVIRANGTLSKGEVKFIKFRGDFVGKAG